MAVLEIRNLVKRLGGRAVVDDVSMRIEDGEFFVLLGGSGSGKSTLLRLICGLETPDAGQVLIDDQDVTKLPARERNLGMVFQDYGLYPNMNVFQNIAYGLEARGGLSKAEIEQRVAQAANMLGLNEMLRRSIVDLSGGEQQRVALARALAKDSSAYLFDEPLSNLDPKLRYQARRDILSIHRTKRTPSLYVTHDQTEAFAMADRIGVMTNGKLLQVGTVDELLHAPNNMYVAGFIGSPPMNLVWGDIKHQDARFHVVADGLHVVLPEHWESALSRYTKERVVLGVRPDALVAVNRNGMDNELQTVQAQVQDVEPLIGETVVTLKVGKDTHLAAVFQDDGMDELESGAPIQVGFNPQHICLFDPDSQEALTTRMRSLSH